MLKYEDRASIIDIWKKVERKIDFIVKQSKINSLNSTIKSDEVVNIEKSTFSVPDNINVITNNPQSRQSLEIVLQEINKLQEQILKLQDGQFKSNSVQYSSSSLPPEMGYQVNKNNEGNYSRMKFNNRTSNYYPNPQNNHSVNSHNYTNTNTQGYNRFNKTFSNQYKPYSNTQDFSNFQEKSTCSFCHKLGHSINSCYLRYPSKRPHFQNFSYLNSQGVSKRV